MAPSTFARRLTATKAVLSGIATHVPMGMRRFGRRGTGGSISARYCYSVWLRHLVHAEAKGLNVAPTVIAELGPGDSLGVGLCALLCGAEQYFAFDVVKFASLERNLSILDGLVDLLSSRAAIPGPEEFPEAKPALEDYAFPSHILTEERLGPALDARRVQLIRDALLSATGMIQYRAPWYSGEVIDRGTVDVIFSQAVLEHVTDPEGSYAAMRDWLKTGGYVSHQIDLRCHGTAADWNGHWTYSESMWHVIQGARPFLLNREPAHRHREMLVAAGFDVVNSIAATKASYLSRRELATRFREMPESDLTTSGLFVQARKT